MYAITFRISIDKWPTRFYINQQLLQSGNGLSDYLRHITVSHNKRDVLKIIEKNLVKININADLITIRVSYMHLFF